MTFSEGDTKRDVVSGIHRDVLKSKFPMTLMTEGTTLVGGRAYLDEAAMPQIDRERSWAKPNQLPAGPRKKRPSGRLFSSKLINV